jgi:urease accessory protein UreH
VTNRLVVRTPFCAVAVHSCILHITGGLRMSGDQQAIVVRTPFCAVAVHSCILHITGGLRMSGDQPASGENTILSRLRTPEPVGRLLLMLM